MKYNIITAFFVKKIVCLFKLNSIQNKCERMKSHKINHCDN